MEQVIESERNTKYRVIIFSRIILNTNVGRWMDGLQNLPVEEDMYSPMVSQYRQFKCFQEKPFIFQKVLYEANQNVYKFLRQFGKNKIGLRYQ